MKNYLLKVTILALTIGLTAVALDAQRRTSENVPVGFYGKVIDQDGHAVAGAKVSLDFIVSHMDEDRTETRPLTMQTDQSGHFELTGVIGYGVDKIQIQKEGYQLSQKTLRSYVFGHKTDYKPNYDSPVIFRMWKEGGKEQLVGSAWHGKVACDGTTNHFDLLHGSRSDNGNLEIVCTRTPLNYERTNGPSFSYKFEITLIGGSVQTTGDEFTYLAPDAGYLPSVTIERKPGDPQWRAGVDQEFYIKTADGHYGRISVTWDAGHRPSPTVLKWDCSINPSGSRNLER
jgi:hypothetical protein